jgi:hypothetical protein
MHTRLLLLGLLASAHGWATIPQQDTDLIGAWVSQTQAKQAQDQYDVYALSIYRADHSYNESVIVKGSQECTLIKTQGTWAYTSPTLSLTLKDSNMPHAMSAGSIARKTILQAEAAKLTLQDEDQRQYHIDKINQQHDLDAYQAAKSWCLQQELFAKDQKLSALKPDQPYTSAQHAIQFRLTPDWLVKDSPQKVMLMSLTGSMADIVVSPKQPNDLFAIQAPKVLTNLSKAVSDQRNPSLIKLSPPTQTTWQQQHQCYDLQPEPLLPKRTLCTVFAQKPVGAKLIRVAAMIERERQSELWQLLDSVTVHP